MSTYPRTYDLIHADSVFSLNNNRLVVLQIFFKDKCFRLNAIGNKVLKSD